VKTQAQALEDVRGYARAGRVDFSGHALMRMTQRGVHRGDVMYALANAVSCKGQSEEKVSGVDLDGDSLDVVILFEDGILVVTVF
jgi:hypothetical protein